MHVKQNMSFTYHVTTIQNITEQIHTFVSFDTIISIIYNKWQKRERDGVCVWGGEGGGIYDFRAEQITI